MSETEFDAAIGRKLREYAEINKQLDEMTEATRKMSASLSSLGFGISALNGGALQDEGKVEKALAELPAELSPDFLRGWVTQLKQLRGRHLDLKSQLQAYGI